MTHIPQEILEMIGKYSTASTLRNLAISSPFFSKIFNQDNIWTEKARECPVKNYKKWLLFNELKKCWYCHKSTRDRCILLDVPSCYSCHKNHHTTKNNGKRFERLLHHGQYVDFYL